MKFTVLFLLPLGLWAASLPDETTARLLEQRFADSGTSYLLMDVATRRVIAARWPESAVPVSPGSLLKPFIAVAYGESHAFQYPIYECRDRCWKPGGHGRLSLPQAIAQSCNAWFLALGSHTEPEALANVARRFGLPAPDMRSGPEQWIGLDGGWQVSPIAIANAYSELAVRCSDPGIGTMLEGMRKAAAGGTARKINARVYAKTGTARCIHTPHAPGDGYLIALFPTEAPRDVLLVRVHGVPGSQATETAGRMLAILRKAN